MSTIFTIITILLAYGFGFLSGAIMMANKATVKLEEVISKHETRTGGLSPVGPRSMDTKVKAKVKRKTKAKPKDSKVK